MRKACLVFSSRHSPGWSPQLSDSQTLGITAQDPGVRPEGLGSENAVPWPSLLFLSDCEKYGRENISNSDEPVNVFLEGEVSFFTRLMVFY